MFKAFSLACAAVLVSALPACSADVAPRDEGDHGSAEGAEQVSTAPQLFEVWLPVNTTAEDGIPALVAAAHDQLATACKSTPGASIRIFNPLASGDYADVSCAAIRGGAESTGESRQSLTSEPSDGPIGESQQSLPPVGPFICLLAAVISATAASRACKDWRGPNSEFCNVANFTNNLAWGTACIIMF
jgi:hypothetical protein